MKLKPLSKSTCSIVPICPFKAHAHKNLGYERTSNIYAARGKLVHAYKEKIDSGRITLEQALSEIKDPEISELVELSVKNDPFHGHPDQMSETHVKINSDGEWVETDNEAVAYGYLDRVIALPDELVVEELKTGRVEHDDVFERHLYAGLLARAALPHYDKIRFVRFFCRSGNRRTYLYEWKKRKDGSNSLVVTDPDGSRKRIPGRHANPMALYLQKILSKIERTEPVARPGSHCRDWYGSQCQFLGNICPRSFRLPSLMSGSFDLASQQKAFLAFFRANEKGEYLSLDMKNAAMALDAAHQLEAGIKEVEKRVKEWSRENGPIHLHHEIYGWESREEPVINKADALKFLYESGLTWEEIAKAVNISKSSVEKLPKFYQNQKTAILGMFQTTTRQKFGLVKEIILTGGNSAQISQQGHSNGISG